jgi:hypothetical protein
MMRQDCVRVSERMKVRSRRPGLRRRTPIRIDAAPTSIGFGMGVASADRVGNPATPCYAAQSLLDQSGMREEEPPT